ncbi:MAG TPA: tRNA (adenosine(37)-N6)-threonylcarbamoyltransferase complex transferase subunit TsaD [Caldithrix abyssi]|uniref:tRNA N6-adenosine threonylcarbamoyltransferase n=1 Tax=Caldithrix abyssi TaxID=187145 RepID=A0A7V5UDZ4_CALAY|nr:tRNA (adenosine(37)-N6)-threonylcarbamoyltransferase complex transferase subunit TsaD [Caldithrix abyssi]
MRILGVETSCDETSAAVIEDNRVLSNIISSQEVHAQFGGVVPELASRAHIKKIVPIVRKALRDAHVTYDDLDGFAVTYGPGLVGALLVGLNFVKGLAVATGKPFIGVNHIEGHVYGNILSQPSVEFPILFLIVSGGHTQLVLMTDHLQYRMIGKTRDDAVGEALDKGAKLLGLGYPGGPEIDRRAQMGDANFHRFPRGLKGKPGFDFSYSGLKTALLVYLQNSETGTVEKHLNDICASYQQAAIEVLVTRTLAAAKKFQVKNIAIAGGVAANSLLRAWLKEEAEKRHMRLYLPELAYCTDNAAMIARAGLEYLRRGISSDLDLNAFPSLPLEGQAAAQTSKKPS